MMAAELVTYRQPVSSLELAGDAWVLAQKIAATEFVPPPLRGKPEAVLACILAGHEAGISPMQSLAKIHVIEGKPAMAAELMRALVLQHGHDIHFTETGNTRVTVTGARRGSERPATQITYTLDDAKRAGLADKPNWRRYPRAMLTARATAELCRMLFPDVLAGISYTIEELTDGDNLDSDTGPTPWGTDPTVSDTTSRIVTAKARNKPRKAITRPTAIQTAHTEEHNEPPAPEVPELPELPEPPGDPWPKGDWAGDNEPEPVNQPRYSASQLIAIRFATLGVKGDDRYRIVSNMVARPIKSSKELTPAERDYVLARSNELTREETADLLAHLDEPEQPTLIDPA
jgi:hypothetical protein